MKAKDSRADICTWEPNATREFPCKYASPTSGALIFNILFARLSFLQKVFFVFQLLLKDTPISSSPMCYRSATISTYVEYQWCLVIPNLTSKGQKER